MKGPRSKIQENVTDGVYNGAGRFTGVEIQVADAKYIGINVRTRFGV
jgi:hypothetical protein